MLKMVLTAPDSASPPIDAAIAGREEPAWRRQRAQLRDLGLTDGGITARVRRGTIHRRHHGVYAVGHTVLGARGRWMAAVLACRPNGVLSHAAAGALWDLRRSETGTVDVTVTGTGTGGRQRRPGIRVHRARALDGQTDVKDGIPVTTPGRAILDLATTLDRRGIERLLDHAENARVGDAVPLDALARALAGHRGAAKVLAVLHADAPGTTLTKSDLEELFLPCAASAGYRSRW
jgi:hypothetical protein